MFYVPKRNQGLIRSSLPTSHGYKPIPRDGDKEIFNPLMTADNTKSDFEVLFEFVGTLDNSPYLCISEALKFRREICGGDANVKSYCQNLADEASEVVAEILGTEVMQNREKTLTNTFMFNMRLPLTIGSDKGDILEKDAYKVAVWMTSHIAEECETYLPVYAHAGKMWTRWSAQIYLEIGDFVQGAETLKRMCDRVKAGEYLSAE